MILYHKEIINYWKEECQTKIAKSIVKKYRLKQYYKSLNDMCAFKFYLTREQTRYKQVNYIKSSYKVSRIISSFSCDYNFLLKRNEKLKSINYECTLNEYYNKNQRKLMTENLEKR